MSDDNQTSEANAIEACTISRDVQLFDLLIEDMEGVLGENWGDLGFADALAYFEQPEATALRFVALAVDGEDERNLDLLVRVITAAKKKKIDVILITDELKPTALHQLMRAGADEFVPYPLPENELKAVVERLERVASAKASAAAAAAAAAGPAGAPAHGGMSAGGELVHFAGPSRNGVVVAVQPIAGGTGATTFAVNLAWELANVAKTPPKVCLLDLSLQQGSVATYLDMQRRETVFELLSETASMDDESFAQAMTSHDEKLDVLTSPSDIIPLDFIGPEDIEKLLSAARRQYDYVLVDMPGTLVQWTETVLSAAQLYFVTMEMDMRSAQNAVRLKRALQAEDLPLEKLRYVLNRGPRFTDLNGKSRVKRLAESLGISIEVQLPDGGKPVAQAGDHGLPLAQSAAKNPLRKEIAKLAKSLFALEHSDARAAQ